MVAILVVFTILACIGVDAAIQYTRARRRREAFEPSTNPLAGFTLQGINLPDGVFSDKAHTWMSVKKDGLAQVGIDEFLLKAIGHIDEVTMPEPGQEFSRGETLFTIRQGDRKIEIPAPVDGVVDSVNVAAKLDPELLRFSPYETGWVCMLAPLHLATDIKKLSIAEEATAWINDEVDRFQQFIQMRPLESPSLGVVMQDGGVPADGILEHMDNETWNLFSFEFVRVHASH